MKVYYLDNMDCSGVFSTKEKAFESFMTCANRCDYTNIHKTEDEGEVEISYRWYHPTLDTWNSDTAYILEYELDEDNG